MASDRGKEETVLAEVDLSGCPLGDVLDSRDSDQGINETYFAGWRNPLMSHPYWNGQSGYRVVLEDGEEALEAHTAEPRCLIAGDPLRGDYTVEATVRQMDHTCGRNHDDEYCKVARTGIVLRQQDVRSYYIFCIEGFRKVVLYRREDDVYYPLGVGSGVFRSDSYYTLRTEAEGDRLRCFVDGEPVFRARDSAFPNGCVGVRTNTLSRVRHIGVTAGSQSESVYVSRLEKRQKELAEARERYPKPVLWKRLAPEFGPELGGEFVCRFGDLRGMGRNDLVVFKAGRVRQGSRAGRLRRLLGVSAMDLEGETLWVRDDLQGELPGHMGAHVVDVDGDGVDEVVFTLGERIVLLDGKTGETRAEAGPNYAPHEAGDRGALLAHVRPCNLQGKDRGRDLVAMGRGPTLWAYDGNLRLLWKYTVEKEELMASHQICFCDLDGDGRHEIVAGYWALSSEGRPLWTAEHWRDIPEHADSCVAGEFDGDETNGPEVAAAGGGEGLVLMSGTDGRVRGRHPIGHAQGLSVGNFRPDLPGLEILCGTRWHNYGILCLFTGSGELLTRFQPDSVSQGGPAINWTGDGGELIFLCSTREAFGMYDGHGRKVVVFPEDGEFPAGDYYSQWDGQAFSADVVGDARDEVVIARDGVLYIYTQDTPYPKGERIYAPFRIMGQESSNPISLPRWSVNDV